MEQPKCKDCRFWRDKAWDGDNGIGICDNAIVIAQVTMLSNNQIKRFVKDKSEAKMISQSMRFNSDFGCIHFSKI